MFKMLALGGNGWEGVITYKTLAFSVGLSLTKYECSIRDYHLQNTSV